MGTASGPSYLRPVVVNVPKARHFSVLLSSLVVLGLAACDSPTDGPPVPTELQPASPLEITGPVARPAGDSIRVRLVDQRGDPFQFARVFFTVTEGGGSVSPESMLTDEAGIASAEWTFGPALGPTNSLRANAGVFVVEFSGSGHHDLSGTFLGPYSTPVQSNLTGRFDWTQTDSTLTGTFKAGNGRQGDISAVVSGDSVAGNITFTDGCNGGGVLGASIGEIGRRLIGTLSISDCEGDYLGGFNMERNR